MRSLKYNKPTPKNKHKFKVLMHYIQILLSFKILKHKPHQMLIKLIRKLIKHKREGLNRNKLVLSPKNNNHLQFKSRH